MRCFGSASFPSIFATGLVLVLAGCTATVPQRPNLNEDPRRIGDVARSDGERSAVPTAANVPEVAEPEPVSQTAPAEADLETPIPFDPDARTGVLDNGLTWYVRENHKPENRAELRLVVNAGSMQEDEDQRGLAHFVEHMAFNGTEHFEKQEIVDYLESIGMRFGPDVNAFTSFDQTVYMLQVPMDDEEVLDKAFLILEDWAGAVSFEGEEIDKERGVVLEEWRLGRGAQARMRDDWFPVLFKGSRYAERLVIGDPEIIEHAPHDALRRYYADWYRPELMAVIAVGDFEAEEMIARIREHFSRLEGPEDAPERREWPVPDHPETLTAIATDAEATRSRVSVYYKLDKRPDETLGDLRRQFVEGLYSRMLNARLDEVRQQPDPPFLFAFSGRGGFVRTKDVLFQAAGVPDGGAERGLEALLTEVERVDRHGFTPTELERAKTETLRQIEQMWRERDKQQSGRLTWQYMSHFLDDDPTPGIDYVYEQTRRLVPGITLEEVNELASASISEENRVIVYQGPEKEGAPPPTEEALLAVFDAVHDSEIAAYEDRVRDEPLVAQEPEPGRIVETKLIPEIGVTEWSLSNGIEVVLKPTDFQNDEVRLTGWSPGGHSLVSDEDYLSATYATSMLSQGGLGEFDEIELEKALAGKVASAWAYISELEEGAGGSASPEDLETMFQLLYLNLTAPRADPEAVEAWRDRSRASLENRLSRPETVFSDRWSVVVNQDHPRRQPPSVERLEAADLQEAYRIHRERFADLGDFTFVIVGNFTPSGIEPLVCRWIGGLPSTDREETWRDVGVEEPPGVVRFEVRKGVEPKARTRIYFHGDAEWSREEAHLLGSLAGVLRIRLREILREDMGGTYGVGVGGGISRRPREEYGFTVSFGSAPENVEKLTEAVFEEIERVKREGVDQEYVDKVKEGQLRSRETALEENRFWLNVLERSYTYGTDPRLILAYDELVETVTAERIQEAARRYLDMDQYVLGVHLPEEGAGGDDEG